MQPAALVLEAMPCEIEDLEVVWSSDREEFVDSKRRLLDGGILKHPDLIATDLRIGQYLRQSWSVDRG